MRSMGRAKRITMNGKANLVKDLTEECRKFIIFIIMLVYFSDMSFIGLQEKAMVPVEK